MKEKYYCSDCGSQMKAKEFLDYYDFRTGIPCYKLEAKCPNARWWKMGHFSIIYSREVTIVKNPPKYWGTRIKKCV